MAIGANTLENLVIARGKKAYRGQINPWDLPEWRPSVEGIRTSGARNLEDLGSAIRKSDVRGPAAGLLLGRQGEATEGNVLNLATNLAQVPGQYVQQGVGTEQDIAKRELERRAQDIQYKLGRKGIQTQRDISRMGGITSGFNSVSSNKGCCFIFIEGEMLTDNVRSLRDMLFPKGSSVEIGYRKMAQWLVPWMAQNWFIKKIIQFTMLNPICTIADHFYGYNSWGWVFRPIGHFWKKVWERMGR